MGPPAVAVGRRAVRRLTRDPVATLLVGTLIACVGGLFALAVFVWGIGGALLWLAVLVMLGGTAVWRSR